MMRRTDFDFIAPFYDFMERWFAGGCLHRARIALLDGIVSPAEILLVGEGHGRFLMECRSRFPDAHITVLDGSAKMLSISKEKLGDARGVTFVHCMIEDWEEERSYDLIVTNFLLDCLTPEMMRIVLPRLASFAVPGADWLIADFGTADRGIARLRAKLIVRLLYIFFRLVTRIPANSIHPPDDLLEAADFTLIARKTAELGLLKSEHWKKSAERA